MREAKIGCIDAFSVVIGQNANVDVRAVDSINIGSGLHIQSELRCDKVVSLEGSEVDNGGTLTVSGESVTLLSGFSIKAGGMLSITTNQ